MGTSYTTHVYYGAPFTEPEPADEDSDVGYEDKIVKLAGWDGRDYDQRFKLMKQIDIEVGWSGYLEWDDNEQWLHITSSERNEDGTSIPLTNLIVEPDWADRIRDWADKLGVTLVHEPCWHATMSAG